MTVTEWYSRIWVGGTIEKQRQENQEFKASLVYQSEFEASRVYMRPGLGKRRRKERRRERQKERKREERKEGKEKRMVIEGTENLEDL